MRIALDASHVFDRSPTGVSVYSRRLLQELLALEPDAHLLLAYRANRFGRAMLAPKPAGNSTRVLLEPFSTPLWAGQAGLFHGLNQRLPEIAFPKRVVTFHDLFVMTAEYSDADFRRRFSEQAREAVKRADHVVAVSQHTAGHVAELLGFPETKISVIPHGVDSPARVPREKEQDFRRRFNIQDPFFLSVGSIQTRKNTERIVQAFELLDGTATLVLAGGQGFGAQATLARIESSPAKDRIRLLGYVDDADRQLLYQSATALVFPSLDEGFGIPILEAMAAGLPVVASNRSALPEVAGDAAVLVDPFSIEEIRFAMERLLTDTSLRADLAQLGRARAAGFTWKAAAKSTWDVYQKLL